MKHKFPLFLKIFLVAVIVPSLILSVLAIRSIHNETLLLEKKSEENIITFQNDLSQVIKNEIHNIFNEAKQKSLYLFDQPQKSSDLGQNLPEQKVNGVEALFLFSNNKRFYPFLNYTIQKKDSIHSPEVFEQLAFQYSLKNKINEELQLRLSRDREKGLNPRQRVINDFGLLRIFYKQKKWTLCRNISRKLYTYQGKAYLSGSSQNFAILSWFNSLIKLKQMNEAIVLTYKVINDFYKNSEQFDINSIQFTLNEMLNSILSFENIKETDREQIWNIKTNLNTHIENSKTYYINNNNIQKLISLENSSDGITYLYTNNKTYFKISYPILPARQQVLGIFDNKAINTRLYKKIHPITKEWKNIAYKITNHNADEISSHKANDSLGFSQQIPLIDHYPNWIIEIFPKKDTELRSETKQRTLFLYSLILFSLFVLVIGTTFIFKGISQEQKLFLMKANFLSSVTHELKTPLTSISMFSEMLQRGRTKSPEKVVEYASLINKESNRLNNLIQSILSYTRMEHGSQTFNMVKTNFSECVNQAILSTENIAQSKGLDFIYSIEPSCIIEGDSSALVSLSQSLIENAIKYTNEGKIEVSLYSQNNFYIFKVYDTGIGIDPSERKHIFKDFYRIGDEMTRSSKGSGLGLAIVKKVTESHNAEIQLISKLGEGSTFKILFKKGQKNYE